MALQIDLTPREYTVANNLVHGSKDWEDMHFESKLVLYRCPLNLEGVVSQEKIKSFERELALQGEFGVKDMMIETVRSAIEG